MPLHKGKKYFSSNVGELMHAYKEKGEIGKTKPRNKAHARRIALAIAYSKMRGGK